jgi:uncharacterized protein (DUF697 family)/tellurite resistance protein
VRFAHTTNFLFGNASMNTDQQKAILAIALFAAFADGNKDEREREQIRSIAESLAGNSDAPDLAKLYQDVLLKRITLETITASLTDSGERQLAYEMAVCVCDADGRQSEAERQFLDKLKQLLQLDTGAVENFERDADVIVTLGESIAPRAQAAPAISSASISPTPPTEQVAAAKAPIDHDKTILNYAILTGALELLPQSWASLAIIPLQIKMVYNIGKNYGVELDQGHIKEFIAAAGVGLTSQYIEQVGRKLLGGLLGKMAGKTFGKVGGAATGMAMSFATTYALGQVANRYYAGGRVMNSDVLRDTFQNLLGPAKQLQASYLPQIQQKASTLDATQIMAMVRP